MTIVSNDPNLWPLITFQRGFSYYIYASSAVVVYDWVLTLGQEFDLIWRQRWSFTTVIYIAVRYSGINLTDLGCTILSNVTYNAIPIVIDTLVGVIMIARLYAMYQKSRKMLILLVFVFSAVTMACVTIGIIESKTSQYEELILFGNYLCDNIYYPTPYGNLLLAITWILSTVWEVLILGLVVWIAIKHFRELPTERTIEDCFTVLMRSHVHYFASFAAAACLSLGWLSPSLTDSQVYNGILQIVLVVQTFVIAPRLILSIRQYNAEVVGESDEATAMTSIAFQQRTQMSNGNDHDV